MDEDALLLILEQHMAKVTAWNVKDEPMKSAIERLAHEGCFLLNSRRQGHDWVRKEVTRLKAGENWPAFTMEIHLTYALEQAGYKTYNSVKVIEGDNSDIDITYHHANGTAVNIECVCTAEPLSFWQGNQELGLEFSPRAARYNADGEAGLIRRVQNKIRCKTIRDDGRPCKFPEAKVSSVNIIAVDMTKGIGFDPDLWDFALLSLGNDYVDEVVQRRVLGLFEPQNVLGTDFDKEFAANYFLRSRVNALLFLIDESAWKSPLNPRYTGFLMPNPLIEVNEAQKQAMSYGASLNKLIYRWWDEQAWSSESNF